jgi:serine phosphatase RsbU (regulator of sigma subunit)/anti-sigma regulatory factor (Ser/Thr protein kinase)
MILPHRGTSQTSPAAEELAEPRWESGDDTQAALRGLAAHLSEAMSTQAVVDLALARAPDLLGAQGALVVLKTEERGLRVVGQRTMPRDTGAKWRLVPEDVDFPAARAIRTNARVQEERGDDGSVLFLDSIPLVVDDDVIGAVTYAWENGQHQSSSLVVDTAVEIALALRRAQHFEREQSISVSLQRSMLPSTLPRLDGAEIGALYLCGSREADVGGDWFESILLDDGRLLLAVGDVMGKGLPAATTMSEFRHALKALSVITSSPSELLGHLARYHATRSGDKEQLITLLVALVDVSTGQMTWTSAGHIPPLVVHPGKARPECLDDAQGLPLGLGETWSERQHDLSDGGALILVSDGLVEDRSRSMVEGLALLETSAGSIDIVSAAQLCDHLVDTMVGARTRADDVTVLCLRIDASITAAGQELPALPASVPEARSYVARELDRLGVDDMEAIETVKLLTSELVTNAVRHSSDNITVCVDRVDHLVRVTVVDTDPTIRLEPRPIEVEAEHGRGLQLVEALSTEWGVSAMAEGKQVWFELMLVN